MSEILHFTTFDIICIFSFDTKCVHYTMETPHIQAIVQVRRWQILEENFTKKLTINCNIKIFVVNHQLKSPKMKKIRIEMAFITTWICNLF